MREIRIDLANAASLATLATPALGGAAALPAGMLGPPGGIYLIVNTATTTRYAGISTNIVNRFNGRMAVVNELGLSQPNMAPIWAWWGRIRSRRFVPPANFPDAFPTMVAGLPLANRYAAPGAGTTVCPAAVPAVIGGAPPPQVAAIDAVTRPIRTAVGAFQAWGAIPLPRTILAFNIAFTAAVGFAPSPGVAAAAIAQATAANAANAAAVAAGAPPAIAFQASAAVAAYAGGGAPPVSDVAAVVNTYYGGPALAAPLAPTAFVNQIRSALQRL